MLDLVLEYLDLLIGTSCLSPQMFRSHLQPSEALVVKQHVFHTTAISRNPNSLKMGKGFQLSLKALDIVTQS